MLIRYLTLRLLAAACYYSLMLTRVESISKEWLSTTCEVLQASRTRSFFDNCRLHASAVCYDARTARTIWWHQVVIFVSMLEPPKNPDIGHVAGIDKRLAQAPVALIRLLILLVSIIQGRSEVFCDPTRYLKSPAITQVVPHLPDQL